MAKQFNQLNKNYNYLDYDNRGWSNDSGYGNLILTHFPKVERWTAESVASPWDRLQPLKPPFNIDNTKFAWSPPLTKINEEQLYSSCLICNQRCECPCNDNLKKIQTKPFCPNPCNSES